MKYMLMMNFAGQVPYQITSWAKQDIDAHISFMRTLAIDLAQSRELVTASALASPDHAKVVRANAASEPVVDGVFPETKEFLVGYWIIEVDSAARAYAIAARASSAPGPGGTPLHMNIEVRQVMSAPT